MIKKIKAFLLVIAILITNICSITKVSPVFADSAVIKIANENDLQTAFNIGGEYELETDNMVVVNSGFGSTVTQGIIDGQGKTIIRGVDRAWEAMLYMNANVDWTFKNMVIDGNKANFTHADANLWFMDGKAIFDNVTFQNFKGSNAMRHVITNVGSDITLNNVVFKDNKNVADGVPFADDSGILTQNWNGKSAIHFKGATVANIYYMGGVVDVSELTIGCNVVIKAENDSLYSAIKGLTCSDNKVFKITDDVERTVSFVSGWRATVSKIVSDDGVIINTVIENNGSEITEADVFVAVYDRTDYLLDIKNQGLNLSSGQSDSPSFEFNNLGEEYKIKAFVWNKDNMIPLTKPLEIAAPKPITSLYYDFDNNLNVTTPLLKGGAIIEKDAGITGDGLVLDGNDAYMHLPSGIMNSDMTIMAWAKTTEVREWARLFDFGNDQSNYLFFAPGNGRVESKADNGYDVIYLQGNNQTDVWEHYVVTRSANKVQLYKNGTLVGENACAYDVGDILDEFNHIGKSKFVQWDPNFKGVIDNIGIYGKIVGGDEIKAIYEENYEKFSRMQLVCQDVNAIDLPEYTFENLLLPVEGAINGFQITWATSNPSVIGIDGRINPAEQDIKVTLTAQVEDIATNQITSKSFDVTVVASGNTGRINFVRNRFDLGISYITEDITLITEIDGVSIEWTGNVLISNQGEVNRPEQDTEVILKAKFSFGGTTLEKDFPVTVIAETSGYLATYIALYEYNMGVEFAEFPSLNYTDNPRTDVMYYALSEDGDEYIGLNNNKPVLYPYNPTPVTGTPFKYKMGSPSLFRKPDGSYGAIASVDNNTSQILVYDSEDLISFNNQRDVKINELNIVVKNPVVKYDNGILAYKIYWEGGDENSYVSTTKDFVNFSAPEIVNYLKTSFKGTLPVYASVAEAAVFDLTAEEYNRIEKKFGKINSVKVNGIEDITINAGEAVTLPAMAEIEYNDGSVKNMGIEWDLTSSGLNLENPQAGEFTVEGIINRPIYNSPVAKFRADPYVVFNPQDNMYYFTSSYMQENLDKAYAYLIVRKAASINGLKDAEEHIIWDETRGGNGDAKPWYWAPELQYYGGKWRMIALSTFVNYNDLDENNNPRSRWDMTILTCEGGDMTNPDHWKLTGAVKPDSNGKLPGAFDTTFFEYEGQCYYVSPTGNSLWIAKFNPEDPLTMTSPLVKIGGADYAWEYNIGFAGTPCDNQYVAEASSIMMHDGKIYLTYAGATVDMHYCIGLLYADLNDDLMEPKSWKKHPLPLLTTADLTISKKLPVVGENKDMAIKGEYKGTFGPGHNSVTIDENGNYVVVYHARDWDDSYVAEGAKYGLLDPGRHAYANSIHFGADGIPIMNMTPEQELSPEMEKVTIKVTVKN